MKDKSSTIYFFTTLILLSIFTLAKWRYEAAILTDNFGKYEAIDVEVVSVDMDRFGYYATIKYGDEIQKKHIPVSNDEAERLYDEMGYNMEDANRETPILLNVRKDKKDNIYSQEEYNRILTNKNPDTLFYTTIIIVSMGMLIYTFKKRR